MSSRIKSIDGFRGIAASLVFLFHLLPNFQHQFLGRMALLGVSMFFVISGYLISYPFVEKFLRGESLSYTNYLLRRIFRIVPLYYLVLLVCILTATVLTSIWNNKHHLPLFFDNPLTTVDIVKHFAFLQIFAPKETYLNNVVGTSWTLSIEMLFYLLVPDFFFMLVLIRDRFSFNKVVTLSSLVGLVFVTGLLIRSGFMYTDQVTTIPQLFSFFSLFCFGITVAIINNSVAELKIKIWLQALLLAGLGLIIINSFWDVTPRDSFGSEVYGLGFFLILLASTYLGGFSKLKTILSAKWLFFLGQISYGIYIWHLFFVYYTRDWPDLLRIPITIIAVLIVSTATFYFVETPFINWARRGSWKWLWAVLSW